MAPVFHPSRINLSPGYPIGLFRMFSPSPTEIPNDSNDILAWYIQRAMDVIWDPTSIKPRYDTRYGGSYYNMTSVGGSFNLDGWINKSFPACNSYDLAAIAQLACTILVDNSGNELVDSRWVYQYPNGYINKGPLYGWVPFGGDHLNCNSPFWALAGIKSPQNFKYYDMV